MQVILAYKNFAANRAVSHIGLGVTALNTAKSMRAAGIQADVWPIISPPICGRGCALPEHPIPEGEQPTS